MTRTCDDLLPGDVYVADGRRLHAEVGHPIRTDRAFRLELVAVLDAAIRRCVGWSAWIAESALLVADALRSAVEVSVPAIFYADRGGGFRNEALGNEALGTLARLGTTPSYHPSVVEQGRLKRAANRIRRLDAKKAAALAEAGSAALALEAAAGIETDFAPGALERFGRRAQRFRTMTATGTATDTGKTAGGLR